MTLRKQSKGLGLILGSRIDIYQRRYDMKNIDKIKERCFDCFLVLLLLICFSIPLIALISPTYSKPVKQQKHNYISGRNLYEDHTNWIMSLGIEVPSDEPTV